MNILFVPGCIVDSCFVKILRKSKYVDKLYILFFSRKFSMNKFIEQVRNKNINLIIDSFGFIDESTVDILSKVGVKKIGVTNKFKQLETSKKTGLEFMERFNINHPPYKVITQKSKLNSSIEEFGFPLVLKADGYAWGCGVSIVDNKEDAEKVVEDFLAGKFGEASKTIIAQKFIKGKEYSLMSFFDGNELISMPLIKDFKKRYASDKGPNTGSMGSILDSNVDKQIQKEVDIYSEKLKSALKAIHADFTGVVYSGLIFDEFNKLYVLEYNMRLGNPEGINILSAIKNLGEVIIKWKDKRLKKKTSNLIMNQVFA